MYRLRNNLIKAAREQACIVLCIVMLATMAGLFSSCMHRYMNDSSANQTSEEIAASPHESAPPVESGLPEEVPSIRPEPGENTVAPGNQPEEVGMSLRRYQRRSPIPHLRQILSLQKSCLLPQLSVPTHLIHGIR